MLATNARRTGAVSLRMKPEIEKVWVGLSEYLHMNRTQVIEQALLRMGRQEGLIAPPRPIDIGRSSPDPDAGATPPTTGKRQSVDGMRALLNDLAARPTRSIPTDDLGRDAIYEDHD